MVGQTVGVAEVEQGIGEGEVEQGIEEEEVEQGIEEEEPVIAEVELLLVADVQLVVKQHFDDLQEHVVEEQGEQAVAEAPSMLVVAQM